jgi:Spy/CpxP family protein refolding chaperone
MRNRYSLIGLIVFLALGLGIAAAQTSGTSSQSPNPPQGSPTAGTQATPPSGSTSAAPPAQSANQPGSVEDELKLTPEQKAKLQPIIQDEMTQIRAVRDDSSINMDQKMAKVDEIKKASFPKIQAVLTPEQQKKLADMQEHARQQQQQQAPTQGAPPKH